MNKYKILVCYSGGKAFIGMAERSEEKLMILRNPRIINHLINEEEGVGVFFDFLAGFPEEIILFDYSAFWMPSKKVESWYLDEISGLSSESFSKSEFLN